MYKHTSDHINNFTPMACFFCNPYTCKEYCQYYRIIEPHTFSYKCKIIWKYI